MNDKVVVGQQVKGFLETLAPVPRRRLWRGIKLLAKGEGSLFIAFPRNTRKGMGNFSTEFTEGTEIGF